MLLTLNVMAQNEKSVVYLSFNDYVSNKLTYEINCNTEKHKIRMNEFFNQSYITVIHNGVKIHLYKDSIYGFISCDEPLVKFHDKQRYYLVEKGSVWIFYRMDTKSSGKSFITEKKYYISMKGEGKFIELSKENLKSTFPDNHKFHDLLDAQFDNNANIAEYDSFHKMYKVNHLLWQSEKQ